MLAAPVLMRARWAAVSGSMRSMKNLPVTSTEVLARFRKPPLVVKESATSRNYLRFRISPEMAIAVGATVMGPGEELRGESTEMVTSRHPCPREMDAYERVLGDAMVGDATHFAREDYVEEAWRIVDSALKADTPVYEYEKGVWGPSEINPRVTPGGGWHNPAASEPEDFSFPPRKAEGTGVLAGTGL